MTKIKHFTAPFDFALSKSQRRTYNGVHVDEWAEGLSEGKGSFDCGLAKAATPPLRMTQLGVFHFLGWAAGPWGLRAGYEVVP